MEKKMETTLRGYMGTAIRTHSFIPLACGFELWRLEDFLSGDWGLYSFRL